MYGVGWGGVGMLTFVVHRSWYAADGYGVGVGMLTFMGHRSWYAPDGSGVGWGGDVKVHGTSMIGTFPVTLM